MSTVRAPRTRVADVEDADEVARLLRAFNAEYDEPAPEQAWLASRLIELLRQGTTAVVLLEASGQIGGAADGLALMRFRPSLWEDADFEIDLPRRDRSVRPEPPTVR